MILWEGFLGIQTTEFIKLLLGSATK
jgi:hypothetical protein